MLMKSSFEIYRASSLWSALSLGENILNFISHLIGVGILHKNYDFAMFFSLNYKVEVVEIFSYFTIVSVPTMNDPIYLISRYMMSCCL